MSQLTSSNPPPEADRGSTQETMESELPSYHQISQGRRNIRTRRAQVEHTFYLHKGGRRWLSLRLHSRAEHPDHQPSFLQGQVISGSVNLDLPSAVLIRSVTISVIGEISADCHRFFTITRQLYVSDSNEILPDVPEQPVVHSGKLSGSHSWPFSIRLPRGVCIIPGDGIRHTFRLPPSMDGKAQIRYHILVRVKRGTLSSGQRLVVPFSYTPQARPAAASVLRQIAYLENTPLIGPEGDPEGWRTLAPTKISGQIFNARTIEVTYALSIARPLCYTRGTVIPLIMTVSTQDLQALDLLSAPSSLAVRLAKNTVFAPTILTPAVKVAGPWLRPPEFLADAVWWPATDYGGLGSPGSSSSGLTRTFHGEIRIPEDVSPSCLILNFQLQYSVVMFPPKAVAFTPAFASSTELLNEKVEIVTVHAQGPLPVTFQPPQYNPINAYHIPAP